VIPLTFTFTAARATTQGGRKYQEDTGLLWPGHAASGAEVFKPLPDGHLLAVLGDGMGGHVGGAVASQLACEHFTAAFTANFVPGEAGLMARMIAHLETANDALRTKTEQEPLYDGMGTTIVVASFAPFELGAGLSWISVGDSLLYLWRRGELARLNEDHSLAPELDKMAEAGKMTWDEAQADPRRHYLRAALTGDDIEMIDVTPRPLALAEGDIILVASDGIHSLDEADIARVVDNARVKGADAIAGALIAAVDKLGFPHQDNTTIIAVVVGPDA
jgi:PPM family protein phosphatase